MRQRGFTLIEMLVVLAMLGVLASAARPLLELSVQRSREHELRQGLRTLREALDAYKRAAEAGSIMQSPEDSGYPARLQLLVDGVADAKSPNGGASTSCAACRATPSRRPTCPRPRPGACGPTTARPTNRARARTCSTCSRAPNARRWTARS
jgi:prepilin-type N-terminal cleavage/methylation domain-containing protein